MDDDLLVAKFHENVGGLLPDQDARNLERCCWDLEQLPTVALLTDILARTKRPDLSALAPSP
jgi:hypothetical protein